MDYSYLDRLHNIDPYKDDNCQKLADYLARGLNWAIAQYDLGDPAATAINPTIPPIGNTGVYTLDTTEQLFVGLYCGFPTIGGALQVVSIDSPTTATLLNISIDPNLLPITYSLLLSKVVAVRDTRSYDAIDISNSSYSMLKVFRQKEMVDTSGVASCDLVISYAMLWPDRAKLPGMMHWVARHLTEMLTTWAAIDGSCPFQVLPKGTEQMTIEYRIMVNDLQQPVYSYLRITLPAKEFN